MKTPDKPSPYLLIQEFLRDDPWKLLVACIMLNQTNARQVHGLINEFFEKWPDPLAVLKTDETVVAEFIRPLGLHNRRAKSLKRMSAQYLTGFSDVKNLTGVGKYAADSYRIFIEGTIVPDVKDKELKNYVAWATSAA